MGGSRLNLAPTFANVSALFWICGILPHGVPSLTPRLTALCPRFVGCACVRLFGRITACSPPVIGVLPQRLSNRYLSVIYYPFGVLCPPVIFRRFTVGLPTVPRVLSPVACPLLSWSVGCLFVLRLTDTNRAERSPLFMMLRALCAVPFFTVSRVAHLSASGTGRNTAFVLQMPILPPVRQPSTGRPLYSYCLRE